MKQLISVDEAKELIGKYVQPIVPKKIPLIESIGLKLTEDIISSYDIPAFPQSSMDGYAFAWDPSLSSYKLIGEVAAGSNDEFKLEHGHAVRIFTGAPLPQGADTVLMQEKAVVVEDKLFIKDESLIKGLNVRGVGTEISKGILALSKGTILSPSSVGFLAGIGISDIEVTSRPSVGIILTGNELQQPGNELSFGQVFDANSFSLVSALKQLHIDDVKLYFAKDDLAVLTDCVKEALSNHDLIMITGGVSVGDYDFTLKACEAAGVESIFHKVKQKPGKPMFFGMRDNKVVFGMPGNPASVLTGFYEYVYSAIYKLMNQDLLFKVIYAPLENDFKKAPGLTHFLKAFYDGEKVSLLTGQESYKLGSFAKANCFAIIPEDISFVEKGSQVEIHLLPN
jgi:molybdopterin molybdotransferase